MTMTPNRSKSKKEESPEADYSWPVDATQRSFAEQSIQGHGADNTFLDGNIRRGIDASANLEDLENVRFDRTLRRTGGQMRDTIFMGKYRIAEPIGRGGMGSVYEAYDANEHRCAIKLMHSDASEDAHVVRRFLQEAKAAAIIKHPNVIEVLDHGIAEDGRPYLVMPYLDGQPLGKLLKERKLVPIKESLGIFLQICDGLQAAHSCGVIHRDIKPSNIMILHGGNMDHFAKIVDFGIAKVFPQAGDASMKQTTTGELFGSPHYMSPEQCKGQTVDQRADIYALGCLMYEVVTGKLMFNAPDYASVMFMQVHNLPPPLVCVEDQDSGLVARMEAIIHKCVAKEPLSRYQTMAELAADLRSAIKYSTGIHRYLSQLAKAGRHAKAATEKWLTGWRLAACSVGIVLIGVAAFVTPLVYGKALPPEARFIRFEWATSEFAKNPIAFKEKEQSLAESLSKVMKLAPTSFKALRKQRQMGDFYRISGKYNLARDQYLQADLIAKKLGLGSTSSIPWSKATTPPEWIDISNKIVLTPSPELAAELDSLHSRERNELIIAEELAEVYAGLQFCYLQENALENALRAGSYGLCILNLANLNESSQALKMQLGVATACDRQNLPKPSKDKFNWCLEHYQPLGRTTANTTITKNAAREDEYAVCVSAMAEFAAKHGDTKAEHILLTKARDLWNDLGNTGSFNAAVANNRLGVMALEGHAYPEAAAYLQESVDTFAKLGGPNDLAKAKAEFNLADALWHEHKYADAVRARLDARRALQSQK